MPDLFGNRGIGLIVQPCPYSERPKHWVEIRLIGEDEKPVPWVEYEVTLPDGTMVRGYMNGDGSARLDGLETTGNCEVAFPGLDKDAWFRRGEEPERK